MIRNEDKMQGRIGLTRVETITGVVVFFVLIALIVPAVQQAREAARVGQCKNSLRNLGLALVNYHETFGAFPFGAIGDARFPPEERWSWYPQMTMWLAQDAPPPIDYSKSSAEPANVPRVYTAGKGEMLTIPLHAPFGTICPSAPQVLDALQQPLATYVGMAGIGSAAPFARSGDPDVGIWGYDRQTAQNEIDDAAHTILVIETSSDRGSWYRGGPATVRPMFPNNEPFIGPKLQFGGYHARSALTVLADGSVRVLDGHIDPHSFRTMCLSTHNEAALEQK
jgi:hypothetical protein